MAKRPRINYEPLQKNTRIQKCEVCGRKAEVAYPDGKGDQVYYCGEHEPPSLFTGEEEK